jgi:hypothetical protein
MDQMAKIVASFWCITSILGGFRVWVPEICAVMGKLGAREA